MKAPPDHLVYLQRRPFMFDCSVGLFPSELIYLLNEYGNWMQALVKGEIQPITDAQEHFLKTDRDEVEPETVHERAWARLKGRREFEREQRIPSPADSPSFPDYGIIESDEDSWWGGKLSWNPDR